MSVFRVQPTTVLRGQQAAQLLTEEGWDVGSSHVRSGPRLTIECPAADLERALAIVMGVDPTAKQIN